MAVASAATDPANCIAFQGVLRRLWRSGLPHGLSRHGDAALRHVRGDVQRRARRPRRAGDDRDRQFAGRPRRRCASPDAGIRPAHHRRAFPARGASSAGAQGRDAADDQDRAQPCAGPVAMPQDHQRARPEGDRPCRHRRRGRRRGEGGRRRPRPPSPRNWRVRSTAWCRCAATSTTPSTTPRAS